MQSVQLTAPKVVIPVFPGTNCEYDTAAAFERAGFTSELVIIRNITPAALAESVSELSKAIGAAQVLAIPGGFSGGDEPEGSAKLIAAFFRNQRVTDATHELLDNRKGLILGICNGFQALIKLGLVPDGKIHYQSEASPTLTFNTVRRHIAKYVTTKVVNNSSPWLSKCETGAEYAVPISHGEGRFVVSGSFPEAQIAAVYTDNPNGSCNDIEGVTSPDGRVFGKMAHSERSGKFLAKNIPGDKQQPIFESAAYYFE
jgi:phosphoribosylformylglycinamidine synthase